MASSKPAGEVEVLGLTPGHRCQASLSSSNLHPPCFGRRLVSEKLQLLYPWRDSELECRNEGAVAAAGEEE